MSTAYSAVPDPEFLEAARRFHRIRWASVSVLAGIVAAAIAIGSLTLARQDDQLRHDEARLLSSCDFYRPLTRRCQSLSILPLASPLSSACR